ncbi:MAG: type II toxin-antitoxin system VapC family toxin [Verrucomicrobia bacterium]|nr:type II toxin-antitoxin system VapC family toxin [Verrucomicrobiota bacterium]
MNILLDTCAISELRKPEPSTAVLDWFEGCNERLLYLSSVTLGELKYGIGLLPDGKRKNGLLTWYARLCLSYQGHIVAPSQEICELWGTLRASRKQAGQPLAMADGLIAATALHESMVLVTRNTADFRGLGIELLNPWQ